MLGLGLGVTHLALRDHLRHAAPDRDVVILANGQSNEQAGNAGAGAPIDPVIDQDGSGRIRVWRASDDSDIAAVQPFTDALWIDGSQSGPLRAFRMAQNLLPTIAPGRKVVIVPCAVGGAGLVGGSLGVGGGHYAIARARLANCLAAFPGAEVILSWTQGEQDANAAVSENAYIAAFTAMVEDLRTVAGAGEMVALLHQMVPERFLGPTADLPYRAVIDGAHKRIPLALARSAFVAASFGTQIASDPSHFTSEGHRAAGDRAMAARSRATADIAPGVPAAPASVMDRTVRLTVSEDGPSAYVVETRAAGSGGAWSEQLVFPETWVAPGGTFDIEVPGTGEIELRLRARSYAGTSAATPSILIGGPAFAWSILAGPGSATVTTAPLQPISPSVAAGDGLATVE